MEKVKNFDNLITLLDYLDNEKQKHIHAFLIDKGHKVVEDLGKKLPSREISLVLGGMGSDCSLLITDKNLNPCYMYDGTEELRAIEARLLANFLELQSNFTEIMSRGEYPDCGTIVYNQSKRL